MHGAYTYRNVFHAVSSITQQQGWSGLMKGYWSTNSVWFPWNMLYIASYEKSKVTLAQQLQASFELQSSLRQLFRQPALGVWGKDRI